MRARARGPEHEDRCARLALASAGAQQRLRPRAPGPPTTAPQSSRAHGLPAPADSQARRLPSSRTPKLMGSRTHGLLPRPLATSPHTQERRAGIVGDASRSGGHITRVMVPRSVTGGYRRVGTPSRSPPNGHRGRPRPHVIRNRPRSRAPRHNPRHFPQSSGHKGLRRSLRRTKCGRSGLRCTPQRRGYVIRVTNF